MSTSSTVLLLSDRSIAGVHCHKRASPTRVHIISTLCLHVFALNYHTIAAQHFLMIQQNKEIYFVFGPPAQWPMGPWRRGRGSRAHSPQRPSLSYAIPLSSSPRYGWACLGGWVGVCEVANLPEPHQLAVKPQNRLGFSTTGVAWVKVKLCLWPFVLYFYSNAQIWLERLGNCA